MKPGSWADRAWPWLFAPFLVAECGCSLFGPPKFTEGETRCLAEVEAREDAAIALCGKDTSGDCSTDAIMDRFDVEASECLKRY